ncbi:MAG: glycosyltransferase family 2 protein [Candidatus Binatia bacterium]
MLRVTAVIVAYNGGPMLTTCVRALFDSLYRPLDVVVVDNHSCDGSVEALRRCGLPVLIKSMPRNLGFAGGVNEGIRTAMAEGKQTPDIVGLVNQDCIVRPGWLGPLVALLANDDTVALAGCRLLDEAGRLVQHAGGMIYENGLTEHLGRGGSAGAGEGCQRREVDYVTGALCAFRVDTWRNLGPFDEGFVPAYFEEADFCVRARAAGMRAVYVPESEGLHSEARSLGRGSTAYLRVYHRSRMRFAAKHLLNRRHRRDFVVAELRWLCAQRRASDFWPVLLSYLSLPRQLYQIARHRKGGVAA